MEEIEIRHGIQEKKTGLVSLFPLADLVKHDQQQNGVGCDQYKLNAKKQIVEILKERSSLLYSDLWPRVIENIAIRQIQINESVRKMKEDGLVYYDLPKGKRVLQPGTRINLTKEGFEIEDFGR